MGKTNEITWGECVTLPFASGPKPTAVSSGPTLSILPGWQLVLDGGDELSLVAAARLVVPLQLSERKAFIGFLQEVHGHAVVGADAGAALLLDCAGTRSIIEFADENEVETGRTDYFRTILSPVPRPAAQQLKEQPYIPPPPYEVTIVLSIRRQTPKQAVLLALDSLNIRAIYEDA